MQEIISLLHVMAGMAIISRMSGGGLGAAKLDKYGLQWLPEACFGLVFGVVFLTSPNAPDGIFLSLVAAAWAYIWMQTGHGTAMHMGMRPWTAQSGRKQFLSKVVDPICFFFKEPLGDAFYCWVFMAIKGLLIGLAAPFYGLLLVVFWPLSYWVAARVNRLEVAEYMSGAFAGLCLWLTLYA